MLCLSRLPIMAILVVVFGVSTDAVFRTRQSTEYPGQVETALTDSMMDL